MAKVCSIHNIGSVRDICVECGHGEHLIYDRDYCSCFPEWVGKTYIGDCCKLHDNMVGQAGTYNPVTPHIEFYKCLSGKVHVVWAIGISLGGGVLSFIKYPYLAYKKYKYRNKG